jgi:hypothetical protein
MILPIDTAHNFSEVSPLSDDLFAPGFRVQEFTDGSSTQFGVSILAVTTM